MKGQATTCPPIPLDKKDIMVHIRVSGRPGDVDAATQSIARVLHVSYIGRSTPFRTGSFRDIKGLPDEVECLHQVGAAVRRGQPELFGAIEHRIEYGTCADCGERVVRVRIQQDGRLQAVGAWSALVKAVPSQSSAPI
jgi:hypothetical protein